MSVLVLGAGMVSGPVFEFLHGHNIPFSVVSCLEKELQSVKRCYPAVDCHCLDVAEPELAALISRHQLVICLLPPPLLPRVAELSVDQRRHLLCASEVPPELMQMHQRAVEAGVMLLCECGLDPGLDHMLAMEVIDKVIADGGQITSFTSWCGGLPAPDCRNNPLQYKFSWNPAGALMALQEDAGYIKDGQTIKVPGSQVLDRVYPVDTSSLLPGVVLEGIVNEFYPHHPKVYGLEAISNFFRGTLRYQGFCDTVKGLIQAGLFSHDSLPLLQPDTASHGFFSLQKNLVSYLVTGSLDEEDFEDKLLVKLENSMSRVEALRGLGLLSHTPVDKQGTPFDSLATHLLHALAYGPGERDMIVMQHEIRFLLPGQVEQMTSVGLVAYGDPDGHSAMARTVGYPLGIAAQMILNGEIQRSGVLLPTTPDIYQPVLKALAHMGISAKVTTRAV